MKRLISWDLETFLIGKMYPAPYFFQNIAPIPVCLSYRERGYKAVLVKDPTTMRELVRYWLEEDKVIMVGQNIAFDLFVAVQHLDIPIELVFAKYNKGLVRDTMIRELLLALATGEAVRNPGKRYSLADLVKKYLKKDISASKGEDAWRLRYSELHTVPLEDWPEEAVEYPLDDARHTLKVLLHQQKQARYFKDNELKQTRAGFDLHLISARSPRVHGPSIEAFIANHSEQVKIAQAPFIAKGVLKPNPNRYTRFDKGDPRRAGYSMDTKKLKRLVQADYTSQGRVVPGTPKGDISLAGDTLKGCITPVLKRYGEAATDIKMMDAFAPMLVQASESEMQTVSPRYGVILKTGRTSCSGPNMQQLPKAPGARECFIPPEGKIFVAIDFSSMEMFCLAQNVWLLYGSRKMLDVLNDNKDPHIMIAANTMGIDYAEAIGRYHAKDELVAKYRQFGKIQNFGYAGGMGAKTTLGNMDVATLQLLKELYPGQDLKAVVAESIKQWKQQWELGQMFNKAGRLTQGGKRPTYTCPITGRIKALNTYCQYCNMHFQPSGADALKEALRIIQESSWSENGLLNKYGVELQIEIHDEVVLAGPVEGLQELRLF